MDVCSWPEVGGVTAYQSYRCSAPSAWLKTGLQVLPHLRFLLRSQCHQGDGIGQASHSWQSRSGRGAVPAEAARSQLPAPSGTQVPGLRVRALGPRGAAPRAPTQEPRPRDCRRILNAHTQSPTHGQLWGRPN